MHILHLEASSGWGGQEMRILSEAEGIRSRGHRVTFGIMKGGKLIDAACKAGFTCHVFNFQKMHWPVLLIRLLLLIRRSRVDLINTHSSLDAWIGGIAARISGIRIVRTRHLSTPIKKGLNSKILYGRLADFVVTTCASVLPMIVNQSGKEKSRCRSIPTGVDLSRIERERGDSRAFRSALGVKEEELLVGTVCFMRSWKGIEEFLRAADILREIAGIKWVLIGGGHSRHYQTLAASLNLQGIVRFTGHLVNPFPAIEALDIFALLSTAHEGVSQAMLQAAYLGKPLIATPTGGLQEVCLDQKTGIQVAPFSPREVADAVLRLKDNRTMQREMGCRAHEWVKEHFTLKQTIDQMEEIYHRVLRADALKFKINEARPK